MSDDPSLRFTLEDLELFSAASRDRNPLHLSADYARRTPYGERVVFGVLGALAGLGRLRERRGHALVSLTLEFPQPMFVGVDYSLEVSEPAATKATLKLLDGKRLVLRAIATFEPGTPAGAAPGGAPSPAEEAADLGAEQLARGQKLAAEYAPDWERIAALGARLGLADRGVGPLQIAVLIGCSYLVGMKLPGRRALFSRLVLKLAPAAAPGPLSYEAIVGALDPRFALLSYAATWRCGATPLAHADLQAFLRQDAPGAAIAELEALLPRSVKLAGKVAVVVGGSRGLGATLVRLLALQGATVLLVYQRSAAEAAAVQASVADAPGRIVLEQGDAADAVWCSALGERAARELGGLDVVICSACPPLLPLWLEPASTPRINDYVARSLALYSAPLGALLEPVAARGGWAVVISSSAVQAPVADWPHYVAAKCAIEGLTRVAALEHAGASFLVVRPPRLLTDLTNTPLGRQSAMPPERAAAAVVRRLLEPGAPGQLEVLEGFE